MKRSDNGVKEKLHTQVCAWPSVFFIQLLLGVTLKGKKKGRSHQGWPLWWLAVSWHWPPLQLQAPGPPCTADWVICHDRSSTGDAQTWLDGAVALLIAILLRCGESDPWLLIVICGRSFFLHPGHKEAQCRQKRLTGAPKRRRISASVSSPDSSHSPSSNAPRIPGRPRFGSGQTDPGMWRARNCSCLCCKDLYKKILKLDSPFLVIVIHLANYCFLLLHHGPN